MTQKNLEYNLSAYVIKRTRHIIQTNDEKYMEVSKNAG